MKWNILALRLKNFLYFTTAFSKFFLEKNLLYFFQKKKEKKKPKKIIIFWKMELFTPKIKNFLIFSQKTTFLIL